MHLLKQLAIRRKMRRMMTGLETSRKQALMGRHMPRLAVSHLRMAMRSQTTMMRKAMGPSILMNHSLTIQTTRKTLRIKSTERSRGINFLQSQCRQRR